MVVLRGSSDLDLKTVQSFVASIFVWITNPDDIDRYRKFDRLETLRENLRNVVECFGYRSCRHPLVLLWQALTAAKFGLTRLEFQVIVLSFLKTPICWLVRMVWASFLTFFPSAPFVSCLSTVNSSWNSWGA